MRPPEQPHHLVRDRENLAVRTPVSRDSVRSSAARSRTDNFDLGPAGNFALDNPRRSFAGGHLDSHC